MMGLATHQRVLALLLLHVVHLFREVCCANIVAKKGPDMEAVMRRENGVHVALDEPVATETSEGRALLQVLPDAGLSSAMAGQVSMWGGGRTSVPVGSNSAIASLGEQAAIPATVVAPTAPPAATVTSAAIVAASVVPAAQVAAKAAVATVAPSTVAATAPGTAAVALPSAAGVLPAALAPHVVGVAAAPPAATQAAVAAPPHMAATVLAAPAPLPAAKSVPLSSAIPASAPPAAAGQQPATRQLEQWILNPAAGAPTTPHAAAATTKEKSAPAAGNTAAATPPSASVAAATPPAASSAPVGSIDPGAKATASVSAPANGTVAASKPPLPPFASGTVGTAVSVGSDAAAAAGAKTNTTGNATPADTNAPEARRTSATMVLVFCIAVTLGVSLAGACACLAQGRGVDGLTKDRSTFAGAVDYSVQASGNSGAGGTAFVSNASSDASQRPQRTYASSRGRSGSSDATRAVARG